MQRVLVTGGAGFIGSHTVRFLLQNEMQVLVLDNLSSGSMSHLDLTHPNLEFVEGDVLEYPLLVDLLKGCDGVIHLAAIPSVTYSIDNPIYSFQVNTQGLLHVLEAVRVQNRSIRIVYASSAAVYGNATVLPCRDDVPLISAPLSPYAQHKLDNERYADLYERVYGVTSLGLRYFNVYGPGQDPSSSYSGVISRFIDAYRAGQEVMVFGDGKQTRDFIHVSDIARANWLALQNGLIGAVNIATGKPQTLLDLIGFIESAGETFKYTFGPERPGDIKESYATVTLASQQLNFKADVSLEIGIASMVVDTPL